MAKKKPTAATADTISDGADTISDGLLFVAVRRVSDINNVTLALPGETCERVLASDLDWLLDMGAVKPKED